MSSRFSVRLLGGVILGSIAWVFVDALPHRADNVDVIAGAVFFIAGLIVAPVVFQPLYTRFNRYLSDSPIEDLVVGLLGLSIGLVISVIVAFPLSRLQYPAGVWLPLLAFIAITTLTTQVVFDRRGDIRNAYARRVATDAAGGPEGVAAPARQRVLLDTSAIIDGRIADISTTGFISGELVVPRFILDELQRIADSPDVLRRNRGRRGLDMLNRMSKDSETPVSVLDVDAKDVPEVDGKLVQVAKRLTAPIITNDFNLNRVAELQGVTVLNINQLANAVKPVVLPGEEMAVHIIQQGKEVNQGVGYLDDGTMIVVEDGHRYLNRDVEIVVTRVLQTVAGRMIFAHPKAFGNGR
jgi:uncharacterized protein YacL